MEIHEPEICPDQVYMLVNIQPKALVSYLWDE